VMAKYLETGTREGLERAESALGKALELNPDLPLAHKLLAQLEVDLGRARDAMARLVARAKCADPELMAGLVSACRYCGLLDASVAAHARAIGLDPKIKTSVPHTWFMQGDHSRVAGVKVAEFPYIVPISLSELGRGAEALPVLREIEPKIPSRLRDFITAARTLLEGDASASVAAAKRVAASDFRDPEGLFYIARHLSHLDEAGPALELLERVVAGGFFCYPVLARDPWLNPLRRKAAFTKLLRKAEAQHLDAVAAFDGVNQ
jgi:tetratricopeptide (TPR) repeat protein